MKQLIAMAGLLFFLGCAPKSAVMIDGWEQERMNRMKSDFCVSEPQVKEYIRTYIPTVTDEQMREWEKSNALECRMIDGERHYFRNAGPNLFRIDSVARNLKVKQEGLELNGYDKVNQEHLPQVMAAVKQTGEHISISLS